MQIKKQLILLLGFIPLALFAQAPKFESYKVLLDQKEVDVFEVYQDSVGYIWLGTNHGLVKYNGVDFLLYAVEDSLYNNKVCALLNDGSGKLWIGHKNGAISILENKKIRKFNPEEGLSKKEISGFYHDNNGVLWFSTLGEGVYYYAGENRKRLYNLNSDDGLLDNYVYSMVQDSNGYIYFSTDKGISIYNPQKESFVHKITMADGLPDNIVKKLVIKNNKLWIGMEDGGIIQFDLGTWEFSKMPKWRFGGINNFDIWSDNEMWISTKRKGVVRCRIDEKGNYWFSNFDKKNGLPDVRTHDIFIDREKNIWIGTQNGLALRKNNNIEFFNPASGFDIKNIFSLTKDDQGNFWIASQEGLFKMTIDQLGNMTTERLFTSPKYEYATFISVFNDPEGFIWAGTYGFGVFKINPKTQNYTQITKDHGLVNNNIIHITGNKHEMWFSSLGGGVGKWSFTDEKFTNFTGDEGLPSTYVYSTFKDKSGKVWLATDGGGPVFIEDGAVNVFSNPLVDSIGQVVYHITADTLNNLWFSFSEQGLIRLNNDSITQFNHKNVLSSNDIQSFTFTRSNELIAISNQGIDIVNYNKWHGVNYGEEDGLAYQEPNLNAIYTDSSGDIFIGTAHGIIKLNNYAPDKTVKPRLLIADKRLFFNSISKSKKMFSHDENHLSFDYIALWYKAASKLTYRYQLEGYDIDWNAPTVSRTVTYSNLPHGKFTFKVQVKLPNGEWYSSPNAIYSFKIKPPFWKTTWFIISAIVLGLLAVYLFILYRTRKLQRDKEILEEEVVKRTAEISKQKEEIEAQRDEIEAQRNHVVEQRDKIEAQNKDIKSSFQYASRIQNAVLPPKQNFKNLLGDYFIFFRPRDIVSGDFYYLNQKNNKVIVAAADCTGHGVPGALMSILGVSLLNQIVIQLPDDFTSGQILSHLRSEIKKSLRQTGKKDETKDGMDISLSVIDMKNQRLEFSGAFNPLLIVRNNEQLLYKGDKMPIGVYLKEEKDFVTKSIELEQGDMLFMYSDGFQDQFGGKDKRKFLPKKLRRMLAENAHLELKKQESALAEQFDQWKGEEPQIDDVLVIGIRVH